MEIVRSLRFWKFCMKAQTAPLSARHLTTLLFPQKGKFQPLKSYQQHIKSHSGSFWPKEAKLWNLELPAIVCYPYNIKEDYTEIYRKFSTQDILNDNPKGFIVNNTFGANNVTRDKYTKRFLNEAEKINKELNGKSYTHITSSSGCNIFVYHLLKNKLFSGYFELQTGSYSNGLAYAVIELYEKHLICCFGILNVEMEEKVVGISFKKNKESPKKDIKTVSSGSPKKEAKSKSKPAEEKSVKKETKEKVKSSKRLFKKKKPKLEVSSDSGIVKAEDSPQVSQVVDEGEEEHEKHEDVIHLDNIRYTESGPWPSVEIVGDDRFDNVIPKDGQVEAHSTGLDDSGILQSETSEKQPVSGPASEYGSDVDIDWDKMGYTDPPPSSYNLSFAGCGFLGIYHIAVAETLIRHGPDFLAKVDRFCGASAGALIASVLAVKGADLDIFQKCKVFCNDLAQDTRHQMFGAMTPKFSMLKHLEVFLRDNLPDDSHTIATDRLFISLTRLGFKRKNYLVSNFESKDHLIKCMLASSYVPFVTGKKSITINGKKYIDGGMTDNLPMLPTGKTIYVSPFCGKQHICPTDKVGRDLYLRMNNQDFKVNFANIVRGLHAFSPPKKGDMDNYYDRGIHDAIEFLKKENYFTPYKGDKLRRRSTAQSSQVLQCETNL